MRVFGEYVALENVKIENQKLDLFSGLISRKNKTQEE